MNSGSFVIALLGLLASIGALLFAMYKQAVKRYEMQGEIKGKLDAILTDNKATKQCIAELKDEFKSKFTKYEVEMAELRKDYRALHDRLDVIGVPPAHVARKELQK